MSLPFHPVFIVGFIKDSQNGGAEMFVCADEVTKRFFCLSELLVKYL